MPSIYAHHTFGRKVFHDLPEDLKKIIRKYPDAFKAGLHGPDFLFFYRPFLSHIRSYMVFPLGLEESVAGILPR